MFKRQNQTYDFDETLIAEILKDQANPLNRITQIIPDGAKVLDIGAGNGLLANMLQAVHRELIVDGVEPDNYACEIANKFYRKLYRGYAKEFMDKIIDEDYDFIILADVIEHMNDPLEFLQELASLISNKTRIIMSVPNIAFGAIRIALLCGDFDYVDSGLLEKTHVRFFTLKTLEELTNKAGLFIDKLYFLYRNIFDSEIDIFKYKINPLLISNIFKDDLSSVYQFLLVLTKNDVVTDKKCFGTKVKYPLIKYAYLTAKNSIKG
jgi:2-polyprenyl-3-methyl-5-hydroxy-6-metoxy-1,4-benzoquinol methylase